MDTQNPLAIESFSCSWLSNPRPSLDSLDREPLQPVASENDPGEYAHQDFYFDVPAFSNSNSDTFAHADELFSHGVIKAVLLDVPDSHTPPLDSRTVSGGTPARCSLLRRWRKSFAQTIWRCFRYISPFLIRLANSRGRTRVDDIDRRKCEDKGWCSPGESSPSPSCSSANYVAAHSSHTEESPIYEAVLHCKRSIEKYRIPIDETTDDVDNR